MQKDKQGQEISLIDLWLIINSYRLMIASITLGAVVISVIYALSLTPIYEAKALLKIGSYNILVGEKDKTIYISDANELSKRLESLYINKYDPSLSKLSSIEVFKTIPGLIELKSESPSNEESLQNIKEVLSFVQQETQQSMQFIMQIDESQQQKQQKLIDRLLKSDNVNPLQQGFLGRLLSTQYEGLRYNYQNTNIVGEVLTSNYPSKPNKTKLVLIVFFVSLVLSIFAALIANMFKDHDNR